MEFRTNQTSSIEDDTEQEQDIWKKKLIVANISTLACFAACSLVKRNRHKSKYGGRFPGSHNIMRKRRNVNDLFKEVGPAIFKRMYRMEEESFWLLLDIIESEMAGGSCKKRKRGKTPNGDITKPSRLAMALRYFAGGDPYDIAQAHGVHPNEVKKSAWVVVDAINHIKQLDIKFPTSHEKQYEIAEGFKRKSKIAIDNCVGAIDGILIWTHKPSTADIACIGFGDAKFFCGRKKKFGLNMQGTCDSRGFFLDVEIKFPGSTSNFFAFQNSDLRELLEKDDFLADGLCLFGDNAYVNSQYMVTPWKGTLSGAKDAFNYFHSSLRINIECAFGMLVHRWAMLRKPIPMNVTVQKSVHLVWALCKLHNFCILQSDTNIPTSNAIDLCNISNKGGFGMPFDGSYEEDNDTSWKYHHSRDRVNELLDGGEHQEDDLHRHRRQIYNEKSALHMLGIVEAAGYRRPTITNRLRTINT